MSIFWVHPHGWKNVCQWVIWLDLNVWKLVDVGCFAHNDRTYNLKSDATINGIAVFSNIISFIVASIIFLFYLFICGSRLKTVEPNYKESYRSKFWITKDCLQRNLFSSQRFFFFLSLFKKHAVSFNWINVDKIEFLCRWFRSYC